MQPPPGPAADARPSVRSRWLRRLGYALFLLVLLEAGSFAALFVLDGAAFTPARLAAEQRGLVEGSELEGADGGPPATQELLHPYLGYLPAPVRSPRLWRDDLIELKNPPFYDPGGDLYGPRPELLRVGVVGGSVAGSFAKQGLPILAEALAADARYAGRELRTVKLAYGGWKQPQQVMALAWLLALGGQLDLVINLDGFNEVALHAGDNGKHGVFPAFPRSWSKRLSDDQVLRLLFGELAYVSGERARRATEALDSPLAWSPTRQLLWRLGDRGLARRLAELHGRVDAWGEEGRHDAELQGPEREFASDDELYDELVALWSRGSRELDALCRAHGIAYLHVLQPNQYDPGSKPLSGEELAKALRKGHPYAPGARAGYPRLRAAGAELTAAGVPFLDLSGVFTAEERTLYIDDCCHVNELGNRLLAEAVAAALRAR